MLLPSQTTIDATYKDMGSKGQVAMIYFFFFLKVINCVSDEAYSS